MKITKKHFNKYLASQGLSSKVILETQYSFLAQLSRNDVIDTNRFSSVKENSLNQPCVRLLRKDLFNESITSGFFDRIKNQKTIALISIKQSIRDSIAEFKLQKTWDEYEEGVKDGKIVAFNEILNLIQEHETTDKNN